MKNIAGMVIESVYYSAAGFGEVLNDILGADYAEQLIPDHSDELPTIMEAFVAGGESECDAKYLALLELLEMHMGFSKQSPEAKIVGLLNKINLDDGGYYLYNSQNYDAWEVFYVTIIPAHAESRN